MAVDRNELKRKLREQLKKRIKELVNKKKVNEQVEGIEQNYEGDFETEEDENDMFQ